MRLLQVDLGPGRVLDLHPRLSVVRRLVPGQRQVLLATVTALAEGRRGPVPGLVEAHGMLFPVDSGVLESLPHTGAGPERIVGPEAAVASPRPHGRAVGAVGAAARVRRARLALDRAEDEARGAHEAPLDRDQVDRLEAVHGRLLAARRRVPDGRGRTRARVRVEQLAAAEAAQLEVLGFASYADYLAATALPGAGTEAEGRLDAARLELVEAEAALREAESRGPRPGGRLPLRSVQGGRRGEVLARVREAAATASVVGSLPVVVDGVLRGVSPAEAGRLLDELDGVADRSQVILLADGPRAVAWAVAAGARRAAVVHPAGS